MAYYCLRCCLLPPSVSCGLQHEMHNISKILKELHIQFKKENLLELLAYIIFLGFRGYVVTY